MGMSSIQTRIDRIGKKEKNPTKKYLLSNKNCREYLENFQKHFVLVPADKTSNNVLIVCKKYYVDVVLKELDTCTGTSPQTYTPCSARAEDLVKEHQHLLNRQNIKILDSMPNFYWLPKMHKNPIGSRFIAASSACTTKPLSQVLTSSLKLITNQYCEGITWNTGVSCFWIIDNAAKV